MEALLKREDGQQSMQEKAEVRQFVNHGMKLIHSPETRDELIKRLGIGEKTEASAQAAYTILEKLERTALEQGTEVDDIMRVYGGNELAGQIIEVAEASGIPKFSQEERAMVFEKVVARVLDRDIKNGRLDPQELQAMAVEAQKKRGLDLKGTHNDMQRRIQKRATPRRRGQRNGAKTR